MEKITVGNTIHKLRKERGISLDALCKGICSKSTLIKLENNERIPEMAVIDNLIRRLGKSPDKLEIIVSAYDYQKLEDYDAIIDDLRMKNYTKAIEKLSRYENEYNEEEIDTFYIKRLYAILAYQKEQNYVKAERILDEVIHICSI